PHAVREPQVVSRRLGRGALRTRRRSRDRHAQLGRPGDLPRRRHGVVALRQRLRMDPSRAAARRHLVPRNQTRARTEGHRMIVLNDPAEMPDEFGSTVVAIGKFDGVHAGHRALIEKLLVDAAADDARTVAVTFDRHPLATIAPDKAPEQVVSIAQKIDLLAAAGLDAALVLTFDAALASVPAQEFVLRYLVD